MNNGSDSTDGSTEMVTQILIIPDGVDPDDESNWFRFRDFVAKVEWKGSFRGKSGGGFAVTSLGGGDYLSRSGKWSRRTPEDFQRWQYRFENLDESVAMAKKHVLGLLINGKSLNDWLESDARNER